MLKKFWKIGRKDKSRKRRIDSTKNSSTGNVKTMNEVNPKVFTILFMIKNIFKFWIVNSHITSFFLYYVTFLILEFCNNYPSTVHTFETYELMRRFWIVLPQNNWPCIEVNTST